MNFTNYVISLAPAKQDKLYDSPWTSQALLRSLSPLAKQYVLRLVFLDEPVPKDCVGSWIKEQHLKEHVAAIDSLLQLQIFKEAQTREPPPRPAYTLHATFKKHIRWALSPRIRDDDEIAAEVLAASPTPEDLDAYAHQHWEDLLLFMLNGRNQPPQAGGPKVVQTRLDVTALLYSAGLITKKSESRQVTEKGFQFLLMPIQDQVWEILQQYVKDAETASDTALSSVMSFLMSLGFRRVGQAVPLASLSTFEATIASHMSCLGLCCPFQVNYAWYFCPTRLSASLCGGHASALTSSSESPSASNIIVETNYRVNAYTSSPIHRAILELFTESTCVLPNLYVGAIKRDSILNALSSGISGDQIIGYLRSHLATIASKQVAAMPEVVVDAIRLWEAESVRVKDDDAVCYDNFETEELYRRVADHARNRGFMLWNDLELRRFVAKAEGHEDIKMTIQKTKEQLIKK